MTAPALPTSHAAPPMAAIFGCEGSVLSDRERAFFRETNPLGFILFQRNCEDPDQIKRLIDDLRQTVGRLDAPVLIDQEGGRVARLKPPHWRVAPPARAIGELAKTDWDGAKEAAYLNARLLAYELRDLGITVDCAPVIDLPQPGAHDIIGDRAFGASVALISTLGAAAIAGFIDGGVLPVIKHIPGHGRALVDSHLDLPVVDADRAALSSDDFQPFRAVKDAPWAMTAHVVYTALDAEKPATLSPAIIAGVIRGDIGFDGVLVSDDLSMKALGGPMADRARDCLSAGCDVALHCNGDMLEMTEVAKGAGTLDDQALRRLQAAESMRQSGLGQIDWDQALQRFEDVMAGIGA